jgi:hypothetical protein
MVAVIGVKYRAVSSLRRQRPRHHLRLTPVMITVNEVDIIPNRRGQGNLFKLATTNRYRWNYSRR